MSVAQQGDKFQRLCDNAMGELNQGRSWFKQFRLPSDLAIAIGGWAQTGKTTLAYYCRDGRFRKDMW